MCIRDRALVQERHHVQPGRVLSDEARGPAVLLALHARVSVCLLYTSDAADERSSVDLGGRRIIKKKKSDTLHDYQ